MVATTGGNECALLRFFIWQIWDLRGRGVQRSYDVGAPVSQVVLHPNQGELISSDESGAIQVRPPPVWVCCRCLL